MPVDAANVIDAPVAPASSNEAPASTVSKDGVEFETEAGGTSPVVDAANPDPDGWFPRSVMLACVQPLQALSYTRSQISSVPAVADPV